MKKSQLRNIIRSVIKEQFRGAPGGTTAFGKGTNTFRKDAQRFRYDFKTATVNKTVLPPSPTNPGVFELKNPRTNIQGVVR